jgi:hypothetical protein
MENPVLRRLPIVSGRDLADWLNSQDPEIKEAQRTIADYLRWLNSGRRGSFPHAERSLFIKPIRAKVSVPIRVKVRPLPGSAGVLEIIPFGKTDHGWVKLAEVSRAGLLNRVRECPRCRRWFFAADLRKDYCGDNCRGAFFAAHAGKEKAALRNRKWRIENIYLPVAEERIKKLGLLTPTKSVAARLERARNRYRALEEEYIDLKEKLQKTKEGEPDGIKTERPQILRGQVPGARQDSPGPHAGDHQKTR